MAERDSRGRFVKGQLSWNKGTKGVMKAWNKGKSLVHSGSFKKGHKGFVKPGYKLTEDQKENFSKIKKELYKEGKIKNTFKSGSEHPNWNGGTQYDPYDKTFNNKFKNLVRKRDNQICMACGSHREKLKKALHIHHVNYDKLMSIPQNCISLCIPCHMTTNFNRKYWITFFQNLLRDRYDYQYSDNKIIMKTCSSGWGLV